MSAHAARHHRSAVLTCACCVAMVLGLSLAGCGDATSGSAAQDEPLVLATTPIWADVASHVTCSELVVDSVVPAGVDPHDFELDVRDADRVGSADVLITNGLGLEENLTSTIERARGSGVDVIELGPELDPLDRSDDHADHDHGQYDPHVWMDPDRVAHAAQLIADELDAAGVVPLSASELRDCTDAYVAELEEVSSELDAAFAGLDPTQRRIVTDHDALGYLEDRYDIEVIGSVVPSTSSLGETSPRELEELAATMSEAGVNRVIGKVANPGALESTLSRSVGVPVTVQRLDIETLGAPEGPASYVELMRVTGEVVSAG